MDFDLIIDVGEPTIRFQRIEWASDVPPDVIFLADATVLIKTGDRYREATFALLTQDGKLIRDVYPNLDDEEE